MDESKPEMWIGIDADKESHRVHILDDVGAELLSRRVYNDEAQISLGSSTRFSTSLTRSSGPLTSPQVARGAASWTVA
jgi:hypothetical protein